MTVTRYATGAKPPAATEPPSAPIPATDPATETDTPAVSGRKRRYWAVAIAIVVLAVIVLTLRGRLPSAHAVAAAVASANARWVTLAAVLEAVSMGMFARQQRTLLLAVSVRMSLARALAVTYARSAMSISMPAGSAVSAGFAFQQYRRSGASREHAAAVMVLSGVVSFLGLAMLYATGVAGFVLDEPAVAWRDHSVLVIGIAAACLAAASIWFATRSGTSRGTRREPDVLPVNPTEGRWRMWFAGVRSTTREAIRAWQSIRPVHWIVAIAYAIANWLTDLLCLICVARAFGLPVGVIALASIYLGVQLVRQIPITPGGIGLIETGLLAGLTSAGAAVPAAAAVVLTYRILSCWLVLPIGGLAWLGLRRRPRVEVPV